MVPAPQIGRNADLDREAARAKRPERSDGEAHGWPESTIELGTYRLQTTVMIIKGTELRAAALQRLNSGARP